MAKSCKNVAEESITLDTIARGDVDVEGAENIIKNHIDGVENLRRVYNALATHVWRVVGERRKDDDLVEWHGLILDVAFRAERQDEICLKGRFSALADLVHLSVNMSTCPSAAQLMKKTHVPDILLSLARSRGYEMERTELKSESGLQSANLSRLMTLLVLGGLVEREQSGKHVTFRLTKGGHNAILPVLKQHAPHREHVEVWDNRRTANVARGLVEATIKRHSPPADYKLKRNLLVKPIKLGYVPSKTLAPT